MTVVPNPTGARNTLRVATALASMIACLLAAMVLSVLVGSSGRDLRPAAIFMAILLVAAAFFLSRWRAYRVRELIVALFIAELLFAAAIGWFASGGLPQFDGFFFSWFITGNRFLAWPWLAGVALGAYVRHHRFASRE